MSTIPLRNNTYTLEAFDANLSGSTFEDCALGDASLKFVSLQRAQLEMVRFDGARLSNVSFEQASIERVNFSGCAIKFGRYEGMTIEGVPVIQLLQAYFAERPGEREALIAQARAAGVLDQA